MQPPKEGRDGEDNLMTKADTPGGARPRWLVGASYGGTDDQTQRFIAEGIWKNGYKNKYLDAVRSMRQGDRIAIKASYTRKHGLPFDNGGEFVSVVGIKAVGTIVENLGDGQVVRVAWAPTEPVREWYFFTDRATVWRVMPGSWKTDALIAFVFEHKPQDIERFRPTGSR
jgi:5-methylcytosine-specific restriction protein B